MTKDEEVRDLMEKIADGFSLYRTEQQRQAVVIDNKDPDKKGRVKIRVSGVHPLDLPEDECPWVQISPEVGTNMGQGEKNICQIGQFVEVMPTTPGESEWVITSGSPIVDKNVKKNSEGSGAPSSGSSVGSGGSGATPDNGKMFNEGIINKVLENEFIPKIASTDMTKLLDTVFGTLMAKMTKVGENLDVADPAVPSSLDNGAPVPELPGLSDLPGVYLRVYSDDVDLTNELCYNTSEKNLGSFSEKFYFYDQEDSSPIPERKKSCVPEDTNLELLDLEDAYGWDKDGNKAYPRLDQWQLVIPPNMYYGEEKDQARVYTISYKVSDKSDPNNSSTSKITFKVAGPEYEQFKNPLDKISMSTMTISTNIKNIKNTEEGEEGEEGEVATSSEVGTMTVNKEIRPYLLKVDGKYLTENPKSDKGVKKAATPEYNYKRWDPEDDKGVTEKKKVQQYPNGMAITIDGTEDNDETGQNAYYSVKHPTGSRLSLYNDGRVSLDSNASMQIENGQNLLINTGNTVEMSVGSRINLKVPKVFIECESIDIVCNELNIKGDINIVGNINMEGNITLFGNITQTGNQDITGGVTVSEDVVAGGISLRNHVHTEQGDGQDVSKPK